MTEVVKAPAAAKAQNGKAIEVGKAKRSDEELKKMGVAGSLILIVKKAVKLAKAFKFEGIAIPDDKEAEDAEGMFYRLHKAGGVIERMDQAKEPFAKLRELAKKAVPDMMKYTMEATDAVKKSAYSANVKAFLNYASDIEPERKATNLDMGGLAGIEL